MVYYICPTSFDTLLTASLDWSYLQDSGVPPLPHHEGVKNTAHCHQWKEAGLVPGRGVPGQHTSVYLRPEEETITQCYSIDKGMAYKS